MWEIALEEKGSFEISKNKIPSKLPATW